LRWAAPHGPVSVASGVRRGRPCLAPPTAPALANLYLRVMGSLNDVARAAGVSKSVASRALTGDSKARMREDTRLRVLEIAERLGYVPNRRAIALRFNRSGAIALIVPDPNNSVFAEMLAGI